MDAAALGSSSANLPPLTRLRMRKKHKIIAIAAHGRLYSYQDQNFTEWDGAILDCEHPAKAGCNEITTSDGTDRVTDRIHSEHSRLLDIVGIQ